MTGRTSIPRPGTWPLPGFLATPAGAAPDSGWPAVVVIHEAYGPTDDMRRVVERFAAEGYVALMPDVFAASRPRPLCIARCLAGARTGSGPAMPAIAAAHRCLAARPDVDEARIGVIGFCMGGSFALAYAATGAEGLRAASVNYGDVPAERERLAKVCPVVASYGGRDRMFAPKARRLEDHLAALGIEHDVKVYDDAGHSFLTGSAQPDGPLGRLAAAFPLHAGFVEDAASDAWRRIFAFLDRHLRGSGTTTGTGGEADGLG